jgi:hypothetical protein
MSARVRLHWTSAGMALAIAATGCGGGAPDDRPRVAVRGTVTLDGQPLENAVIRFVPLPGVDGPTASNAIVAGTFELPAYAGPVAGPHRVEIESTDHGGIEPDDETALAEVAAGKRKPGKPVKIPAIYNSRSTLERIIQSDSSNEFEFTLVTKRSLMPWLPRASSQVAARHDLPFLSATGSFFSK